MPKKPAASEPMYSFTIPSLFDDIPLDCRIYHPRELDPNLEKHGKQASKAAILAHPYPPLGGSYDDPVILSACEALLEAEYIVMTFNFRGAGDSAGRTSWTSKPEVDDYASAAGLLIYYMHNLSTGAASRKVLGSDASISLILGGYSFGSLILARLPPALDIISRFEQAERGTACSEIFLRARTLARQTLQETQNRSATSRGRGLTIDDPPASPQSRASPVTVGGEETDPSERRRSRDTKHSADVIREMPHKIKSHIRKHSGAKNDERPMAASTLNPSHPVVAVTYLIISPVLVPFSTTILPPGISFPGQELGLFPISRPTLVVFGSNDTFTSSKKLRQWAEKLAADGSQHLLQWEQIDGAGHFWREPGVMKRLQSTVAAWTEKVNSEQARSELQS